MSPCAESRSRSRSSASSGMLTMRVDGCSVTPSKINMNRKSDVIKLNSIVTWVVLFSRNTTTIGEVHAMRMTSCV